MTGPVDVAARLEVGEATPPGAPVVLLSNSLGTTRAMWDRTVPALLPHFRVLRYDTRGHGASPVPPGPYTIDDLVDDVVALLDRLGLDRVHVVGLSLGGMTGMRLAARHPVRVNRLALLCTGAFLEPRRGWHERAATVRAHGMAAVADAVVARWYTPTLHERDPARIAGARAMLCSTPAEGYAGCCEVIGEMDLRSDLPSIAAPTLAIAGEQDPATPPEHLRAIAAAVPRARLAVVPEAAHLANDEQPDAVNALLVEHLLGHRVGEEV